MVKRLNKQLIWKYLPLAITGFYDYHIKVHFSRILPPRTLIFPVTYRCNSRCLMCNIWKKDRKPEMSLEQLEVAFSDNLFRKIQNVNITGGEPTLRKDLSQITRLLIRKMPELRKITLTTNALNANSVVTSSAKISEICSENDIDFLVGISLDGIGEVHDEIRNVPRAFERTSQTILKVQELQQLHHNRMRLDVNCTITKKNLPDLENLIDWCSQHNVYANFIIAEFSENYYSNEGVEEQLQIKNEDMVYFLGFLQKLAAEKSLFNLSAYFYSDMLEVIKNNKVRTAPCIFWFDGLIFDIYGDLYYCILWDKIGNCLDKSCSSIYYDPKNILYRKDSLRTKCAKCTSSCFLEIVTGKELMKYLKFLLFHH